MKVLVAMPLSCINSIGLKRDRQFNDVDDLSVPDDDVRLQVSAGNVLGKAVFLPWQLSSDPHSISQVASDEVNNDLQNTVVPSGIASQVKGLLAGVQHIVQGLVPSCSDCVTPINEVIMQCNYSVKYAKRLKSSLKYNITAI